MTDPIEAQLLTRYQDKETSPAFYDKLQKVVAVRPKERVITNRRKPVKYPLTLSKLWYPRRVEIEICR